MAQNMSIISQALKASEKAIPGLLWQDNGEPPADGSTVHFTLHEITLSFVIFYSHHVPNMLTLNALKKRANALPFNQNAVVITEALTHEMFSRFAKADLSVLDTTGNAFLHHGQTYVSVPSGIGHRRGHRTGKRITPLPGSWGPASLRLVFCILIYPEHLRLTVRALAGMCNISIGTVSHTLQRLKQLGFIFPDGEKPALHQRQKLTAHWLNQYAQSLRPSLLLGRYRPANRDFYKTWKQEASKHPSLRWGGEPAADILTHNLVPLHFILYAEETGVSALIKALKLIPDNGGNLELHAQFWAHEPWQDVYPNTAHPLLVYAELLRNGDTRLLELAEALREQYLADFFQ